MSPTVKRFQRYVKRYTKRQWSQSRCGPESRRIYNRSASHVEPNGGGPLVRTGYERCRSASSCGSVNSGGGHDKAIESLAGSYGSKFNYSAESLTRYTGDEFYLSR